MKVSFNVVMKAMMVLYCHNILLKINRCYKAEETPNYGYSLCLILVIFDNSVKLKILSQRALITMNQQKEVMALYSSLSRSSKTILLYTQQQKKRENALLLN